MKSFWANKSREEAEKAFAIAMNVLMVVEFTIVVGIFFLLQAYVSLFGANVWLILAYAWSLKAEYALHHLLLKENIMERIGHGKEDNKEDRVEQDSSSM